MLMSIRKNVLRQGRSVTNCQLLLLNLIQCFIPFFFFAFPAPIHVWHHLKVYQETFCEVLP